MTDNDAFARLKTRTRATVPIRNSSLTETSNDQKTEFSHSAIEEVSQDKNPPSTVDPLDSRASGEAALAAQLPHQSSEVTRRTLRIDLDLDRELESLCSQTKITRETFLEAAYLACKEDPSLMELVVAIAQQRYRHRKQTGEQRKFETMKGKFTQR